MHHAKKTTVDMDSVNLRMTTKSCLHCSPPFQPKKSKWSSSACQGQCFQKCLPKSICAGSLVLGKVVERMPLPPIDALSDDEFEAKPKETHVQKPWDVRKRSLGFKAKVGASRAIQPCKLRNLISSRCGCTQGDCLRPFNQSWQLFETWIKERKLFIQMTKLEQDNFARCSELISLQSLSYFECF